MLTKGLVIKAISGLFTLRDEDNNEYNCRASTKLKLNKQKIITGDYVLFSKDEKYIYELYEREHELIRPKLANVDKIMLIFSAVEPKFNYGLLDRMLLIMEENRLTSSIIVTKMDLVEDNLKIKKLLSYYEQIGYKVYYSNTDLKEIEKDIRNDKYVLTGQSGVGKSTLINMLIPNLELQTNDISKALGRGKHTTRQVTFYDFNGGYIIDTPGFSALDLPLNLELVRDNYIDFKEISKNCRFNNCYHVEEPGCAVKAKRGNNEAYDMRYKNYVKILEDIKESK